jgi:hypothetical protein
LLLRFDTAVRAAACVEGAVVDGASVRIETSEPTELAARLLRGLGPDAAALQAIEVERPSLESVFLSVTGRRYERVEVAAQ